LRQPLDRRADGLLIRKFVRTTRRYRTIDIRALTRTITATTNAPRTGARPSAQTTALQVCH
jgi:hypothetical protein